MNWKEKLRNAPRSPGAYIMRDEEGRPLYVGKAKSIRTRVRTYLDPERHSPKNRLLLQKVRDVEFIVTDTEVEALVLENSLIKKWRPRYNISLRDDKTYPFLRLAVQEEFPTLTVVRKPAQDGARYFGPYVPAGAMRTTLELLRKIFPLRRCRGALAAKKRPCLNYQMRRCLGPCGGSVEEETYRDLVHGVTLFLQGKGRELVSDLKRRMEGLSARERFEEAAAIRDRIRAVQATLERQKAHFPERGDMDVFGTAERGAKTSLAVLQLRRGRIVGSVTYAIDTWRGEADGALMLAELVRAFYSPGIDIPSLVLLPDVPEGSGALEEWLSRASSARVRIKAPRRGELRSLVAMAVRNALSAVESHRDGPEAGRAALAGVTRKAGWRRDISSLAAVDVSNVAGTDTVASLVWFEGGEFRKNRYRRLKIAEAPAGDDYRAVEEAVRRISRKISLGVWQKPDILLVDGGRGQLQAARRALAGMSAPPALLSIAKPGEAGTRERVYAAGRRGHLALGPRSAELHLLQKVRDEAHRFAVAYHRQRRARGFKRSIIDEVPGMGPARKKILLRTFGSVGKIRQAALEDLEAVPGLPRAVARSLYDTLRQG